MDLQINDRIRDNDPRSVDRVLTITCIGGVAVSATDGKRTVGILKRRIFPPGKARRSGFTLLPTASAAEGSDG